MRKFSLRLSAVVLTAVLASSSSLITNNLVDRVGLLPSRHVGLGYIPDTTEVSFMNIGCTFNTSVAFFE